MQNGIELTHKNWIRTRNGPLLNVSKHFFKDGRSTLLFHHMIKNIPFQKYPRNNQKDVSASKDKASK